MLPTGNFGDPEDVVDQVFGGSFFGMVLVHNKSDGGHYNDTAASLNGLQIVVREVTKMYTDAVGA